jgi:hypothetical protein
MKDLLARIADREWVGPGVPPIFLTGSSIEGSGRGKANEQTCTVGVSP